MSKLNFRLDAFISGSALLSIPFFVLFITSVLFIGRGSVAPFTFPVSILLSCGIIYFLTRNDRKLFICSSLFHLIFLGLVLILTAYIYDYSFDGTRYHQDSIGRLYHGWNPVHEPEIEARLWVKHYAKGIEIISASIFSTFGSSESGKAVNFIIITASIFFAYRFLNEYFSFLGKRKKVFLSFVMALSTVTTNQLFTFYVDWSVYSLLLILFTTLLCLNKRQNTYDYIIVVIVVFMAANIKFNIFFWILFAVFLFMIYLLLHKKRVYFKKLFITCSVAALLGVCVGGINPYITNTINHGTPFYPITTEVNFVTGNTPPVLAGKNRGTAFFTSIFSFPKNDIEAIETELALPWNMTLQNIHHSGKNDTLIGGYGLFFSWILTVSIILYIVTYKTKTDKVKYYNYTLISLLISAFILPLSFSARFFPLFYAFPIVMLLYSEYETKRKWVIWLRNIAYFLICANIALSIIIVLGTGLYKTNMVNSYIETLSHSQEPIEIDFNGNASFQLKLDEHKIRYIEIPEEKLDTVIFSPPVYLKSHQLLEGQSLKKEEKAIFKLFEKLTK